MKNFWRKKKLAGVRNCEPTEKHALEKRDITWQ